MGVEAASQEKDDFDSDTHEFAPCIMCEGKLFRARLARLLFFRQQTTAIAFKAGVRQRGLCVM
jgi:hypothetical protein